MGLFKKLSILAILLLFSFTGCATTEPVRTYSSDPIKIFNDLPAGSNYLLRDFAWEYDRQAWSMSLHIPAALYDYYSSRKRVPTENYSVYVTDPMDAVFIDDLVSRLRQAAGERGLTGLDLAEFAIAFVQSLPYASDALTTGYDEYPRYPVETLVDVGGDCEDSSILMAAILQAMGHGAVLMRLPEHMAVGILEQPGMSGVNYYHNGSRYFYLETTGMGWGIGEIPYQYEGQTPIIYDIKPTPILDHTWEATSRGSQYTVTIQVANMGTAAAEKVQVLTGFDAGNGLLWNVVESQEFHLEQGYSVSVTMILSAPPDKYTRILVQTSHDGYAAHESYSDWFTT